MHNKITHQLLDRPSFYNFVQNLFAPGSRQLVVNHIQTLLKQFPKVERMLDVGCGPQSWLWQVGIQPVGLDLSYSYCKAYHDVAQSAITGSSVFLPFSRESFGGVWSVGMFHHLSDPMARQAMEEMIRVCQPKGYVAILDAVLPISTWRRPLAYAIRRADRGQFVRRQAAFETLLPDRSCWSVTRAIYALNGLEILLCWMRKPAG